jgi:hypothetical protein
MFVSELMKSGGKRMSSSARQDQKSYPAGSIPQGKVSSQTGSLGESRTRQGEQGKKGKKNEAPKEWLQPKVYKGTSIS